MNKKKIFLPLLALVLVSVLFLFSGYGWKQNTAEVNYSLLENWAYFSEGGEEKSADLFLICPTVDIRDEKNMSLSDKDMKNNFIGALNMERGIYEDNTRMYAPYYRQASLKVYELPKTEQEPYFAIAYKDVSAAFSYYLKNENKGRPIILAGFSQGADMCYRLLQEYFGDKKLYEQLVAVYAIGWPCTEEIINKYPQIKPAQSEKDFGVVIAFECEAPDVTETAIYPAGQKSFAINPLNWKTDDTYADKNLNLGACFTDYSGAIKNETANFCGGYIDLKRGVLKIPDIKANDYPSVVPFLPTGAYHVYDYQFFFRNLQKNVKDRLEAYIKNHEQ